MSACKKNTFYASRFGLVEATDKDLKGIEEINDINVSTIPSSFSIAMPPIGNQLNQGSCTGWACGYAVMSYHVNKRNGTQYSSNTTLMSPAFVYNLTAKGKDKGALIPDILNTLKSKGICSLSHMPYNDQDCSTQPNSVQLSQAAANKISNWKLINKNNTVLLKKCLFAGYPLVIGVRITPDAGSFYPYIWNSGVGDVTRGHALAVVGFDDARHAFKIQNSWGAAWGDSGFFWIDYDFFSTAVTNKECYAIIP